MNASNPLLDGITQSFWPEGLCGGPEGAWMSTGLWAPAGVAITVTITQSANMDVAKANLGLQIGSHA